MTCTYQFDPDEYERTTGERSPIDDTWECPHPAADGSEYCPVHRPPDETEPGAAVEAIVEQVRSTGSAARFIGARLGAVELPFAVLRADDNRPVDLRHASVESLSLTDAAVHQPLLLDRATVTDLDVSNTAFTGELLCKGVEVTGEASFQGASFDRKAYFDDATLGSASFADTTFDDAVSFEGATVNEGTFATARFRGVTFSGAEFGTVSFANATLDRADFTEASFVEEASFRRASFGTVDFGWAAFHDAAEFGETRYDHAADFPGVSFTDVTFAASDFSGDATFEGADADDADFGAAVFSRDVSFAEAEFDRARFAGARLADCEFDGAVCETATFDRATVDAVTFRDATIGEASFDEARVEDATFDGLTAEALSLARAEVSDVTMLETSVAGAVDLTDALVRNAECSDADVGSCAFAGATFERQAAFRRLTADGAVDLAGATIETGLRLTDADVGSLSLRGATVREVTDLSGTAVEGDAALAEVECGGRATFDDVTVEGDADFESATFQDAARFRDASVDGDADFGNAMFLRHATFDGATVGGRASFRRARFDTSASFTGVRFGPGSTFAAAEVTEGRFDGPAVTGDPPVLDLSGATIDDGRLGQPAGDEHVVYDCEGATLGTVDVTASDGGAPALEYVRIVGTTFEDFDFGQHKSELASSGWRLHTTVDGHGGEYDHGTLEDTYRKAKNGAKDTSDRKAVAELFIRELRHRGRKNHAVMRDGGEPPVARARAANAWFGNLLFHRVCGYGERLWRILAASAVAIVGWAFVFALLPRQAKRASGLTIEGVDSPAALLTPDGALVFGKNLYFSLVTFTTLGYGDVQPVGVVARVLAGLEAFVGAILVALVVFVLGRRISH